MMYTKDGYSLRISLEELHKMLEYAENRAKYGNMESDIYIEGGEYPKIMQYCDYAECNPINHTIRAEKR